MPALFSMGAMRAALPRALALGTIGCLAAACDDGPQSGTVHITVRGPDGGPHGDSAVADAARPDAVRPDAVRPDAAQPDAAQPDAVPLDLSVPDAEPLDAFIADDAAPDAAVPDAAPPLQRDVDHERLRLVHAYFEHGCDFPSDADHFTESGPVASPEHLLIPCGDFGSNRLISIDITDPDHPVSRGAALAFPDGNPELGTLAHLTVLSDTRVVLGAVNGLYVLRLNGEQWEIEDMVDFPNGYNTPGGIAHDEETGDIYVPLGNFDENFQLGQGKVLRYNLLEGPLADQEPAEQNTTNPNPTGTKVVNLLGSKTLAVVNSGPFSPDAQASVDLFDTLSFDNDEGEPSNIPLGNFTASSDGEAAVGDDDNTLVVGTSSGTPAIRFADLANAVLDGEPLDLGADGSFGFLSSVQIFANLVLVTDFNAGVLSIIDWAQAELLDVHDLNSDSAGPAVALKHAIRNAERDKLIAVQLLAQGAVAVFEDGE
jgi:hypothetical protein